MAKRTNRIQVWLNDEELKSLNKKVKCTGMCREGYIRNVLRGVVPIERPSVELMDVIRELRFVGRNMNQIAMRANETNMVDALQYKKNFDMVHKAISKLIMGDYQWR